MSNWGDIAAFQNAAAARATASAAESAAWEARKIASAQQSLADAQARTAQEQARANQIMIEAEEKKNLELKRQLDEQQNFAKRQRYAKGLLVKTEIDIGGLDISSMGLEGLSRLSGELSAVLDFSKKHNLLSDFFDNVEDIRFAHKVIEEVSALSRKVDGSLKVKQEEFQAQQEKERLANLAKERRELNQKLIDSLSSICNSIETFQEKGLNTELVESVAEIFGEEKTPSMIYSNELYGAYCFEERTKYVLKKYDYSESEKVKKAYDEALMATCSHIEYVSQFLDEETIEEIQLLFSSVFDFADIHNFQPSYSNLQDFHAQEFETGDDLCPVCESPSDLFEITTDLVLVICPTQHSFTTSIGGKLDLNTIEGSLQYHADIDKSHYSFLTSKHPEFCENLFRSRIDKLKENIRELEEERDESLNEIDLLLAKSPPSLNMISTWVQQRQMNKRRIQLEQDFSEPVEEINGRIVPLKTEKLVYENKSKKLRNERKKRFEHFITKNKTKLLSCFNSVPADPSSVATAIIKRGVRYYGLDHIGGTYGNMSLSPFKLDDDSTAAATMREDRESNSISIDS